MNVYGVYLSYYVYEVAWFKDLVKVFANENDANAYADEMNKIVKEKTDNIMDAEWHCSECFKENGKTCTSCEWSSALDDEEFEITFANGDTDQISCDPGRGSKATFFVKEIEVN